MGLVSDTEQAKTWTPYNTHTYLVTNPVSLSCRQTADRQAPTYTAHSTSQECVKTEAIALGWDETEAGMQVEARVRPDLSRSAQESFILRQTREKGTVVIRPMEGGGEKRLITSCLEKRSEAEDIKTSGGHLWSRVWLNMFFGQLKFRKWKFKN